MFWVLVSWHVALLCLLTSFQAGSSGHRYHLQLHCVSASCHLLFFSIKKVAAMLDVKSWFSSPHHTQDAIVLTECMHGGVPRQLTPELKGRDVDTCLLSCLSLQICGHGLFKWHLWNGTFYFEHHPYAWCRDEHILPYYNFIFHMVMDFSGLITLPDQAKDYGILFLLYACLH